MIGSLYKQEESSWSDYYPFGLTKDSRSNESSSYHFGFNGKEKDSWAADGNIYDYGFRIYNPQYAKFLSVDPLTKSYPELTPYQFASNTPLWAIDLDGLEALHVTSYQLYVKPKVGWIAKQLTHSTLVSNDGDWSGIKNVNQYFNYQGMIPENEKPSIKQVETLEARQSNSEAMVGAYKSNSRVREGVKSVIGYHAMVVSAFFPKTLFSTKGWYIKGGISAGAQTLLNDGQVDAFDVVASSVLSPLWSAQSSSFVDVNFNNPENKLTIFGVYGDKSTSDFFTDYFTNLLSVGINGLIKTNTLNPQVNS